MMDSLRERCHSVLRPFRKGIKKFLLLSGWPWGVTPPPRSLCDRRSKRFSPLDDAIQNAPSFFVKLGSGLHCMIRYLKLNGTQLSWSYHQRAFCSAVKGCQFGKCKYFLKGFSFPLIELSCTAVHPWLTFITPSDTNAHLSNVWAC